MINNLCACCLRSLRDYPENQVFCDQCKELRNTISKVDTFSLKRAIETTRDDIRVIETRSVKP